MTTSDNRRPYTFYRVTRNIYVSLKRAKPNPLGILKVVIMLKPRLDPAVDDQAPAVDVLTAYDQEHLITYLRLLDADAEGCGWCETAYILLKIDPSREPKRARRAVESHLARAKWITEQGYLRLLSCDRQPKSLKNTKPRSE